MATSLLRLGRLGSLKCLQVDSWGVLKSRSAAYFCTQAEEPAKPAKKTKPSSKTDVQDERATLLAYKTTVAFPVRLSEPGVFPIQSAGVSDAVASPTATAEAVVAAEATASVASGPAAAAPEAAEASAPDPDVAQVLADTAPPVVDAATPAAEPLVEASSKTSAPDNTTVAASVIDNAVSDTASSEPGDPAPDGSSSSSSSDSSSDSDSEDENEKSESRVKEEAEVQEVTSEVKEDTNEAKKEATHTPAAVAVQEAAATAQDTVEAPSVSSEELVDSAPDICTATEDTPEGTVTSTEVSAEHAIQDVVPPIPDAPVGTPPEIVTMHEIPVETSEPASAATPSEAAVEPACVEAASVESSIKGAEEPACAEVVTVEAAEAPAEAAEEAAEAPAEAAEAARADMAAEAVAEASAPVESAEELVDPAPVTAEAAGEELQKETPAEPSEESAAAAPPEPEEHFDNSTYKNYQHHNYNPYTFADLDVEMAKFRLPQPSSIRH